MSILLFFSPFFLTIIYRCILFICYAINRFHLGCPSHFQARGNNQCMLPAIGRWKKKAGSSRANTHQCWAQQCWVEEKAGRWGACPQECWLGPRGHVKASRGPEETPARGHWSIDCFQGTDGSSQETTGRSPKTQRSGWKSKGRGGKSKSRGREGEGRGWITWLRHRRSWDRGYPQGRGPRRMPSLLHSDLRRSP